MNGDLLPALAAAAGGTALISTISAYEHRRDAAMRASRVRLALRFPASLDSLSAKAALSALAGLASEVELVFEIAADGDGIKFFVWVPAAVRSSVVSVLTGAMPGLRAVETPAPAGRATFGLKVFVPTPSVLITDNPEAASRTLLSGLGALAPSEQVIVRWAIRPSPAPVLRTDDPPDRKVRAIQQAWRQKVQLAGGYQAAGLVLVQADRVALARELAEHVASAIRSRRGSVGAPRITYERSSRSLASLPGTTRSSGWLNSAEALGLVAPWPLGDGPIPGVEVGAARELLVPRHVPREGRRLFIGRDSQGERPVALSPEAARHHVAVVGPSGVGKSVLLARSILSDIERGFGGATLDPKGDLIETVLTRVKPEHADRIVVLDPAASRVPGVAVLAGGDPDLRADVLTGAIRSAFPAEAWGVRTDYFLRLAIRTLAEVPRATLSDVGRLFFEEGYRRSAIARLSDPFLITAWQSYAALSVAAQAEHVQAPMSRILALLSRPRVRAVIASPDPKLDVARAFAERKFLLVNLAPGVLGEAGAAIVGAAVMYVIWSAIETRVALPPERRHLISVVVDELATLANGPFSFELLAERARGLGAGLTVAMQTLGRIPEPTRSALIGNVASFITFRAAADEAARIARQLPGLTEADVMALGRFEVAARIGTGLGSATTVVTGRTESLPPVTHQAEAIRRRSNEVYGSDPDVQASPDTTASRNDDMPLGRAGRGA